MIYAEAFDGLPAEAKEAIYARVWQVLSGEDRSQRYARLSRPDRQAIIEILRDTKKGLLCAIAADSVSNPGAAI
jgi:hypothetical protein